MASDNSSRFLKPGFTVLLSVVSLTAIAFAGSLTPPAAPASTFHTLEEIYNAVAGTFDSSSITSSTTGSLIQGIKSINSNLVWASGSNNIWILNTGNVGLGTTSPETKLHVQGSTPVITIKNTSLVSQTWQFRNGSLAAGSRNFDIYDRTASASRLVIQDDGNVMIGSSSNPANNSRVFIFGGTNGANIDVRGKASVADQATIELEGSDYDTTPNSALLQYYGPNGTGTTMGFANQRLGVLRFVSATTALIATDNSTAIVFGTNDTERMRLSGGGFLGIGTTAPATKLEVQGTASASYLLAGNTLQVAGFSSASYSRFGTATATDSSLDAANDLLISGSLEVDGTFRVDGNASHSLAGEWIFDSSTLIIDSGTDRVGIGTTDPSAKLSVVNSGSGTLPSIDSETFALIANRAALSGNDSRLAIISNNTSVAGINFGSFAAERVGYIEYDNGLSLLQLGTSGSTRVAINSSGRVGVGTTGPNSFFTIADSNSGSVSSGSFAIRSSNTVGSVASISATSIAGGSVFSLTLPASSSANNAHGLLLAQDVNGTVIASWSMGGKLALRSQILSRGAASNCTGVNTPTSGCIDYAESFPSNDPTLEAGEVVSLDIISPSYVVRAASSSAVLGIVSTSPAALIDGNAFKTGASTQNREPGSFPIALAGRVPIKISLENGDIQPGDHLSVSTTKPGFAAKAITPGMTVGIALESASSSNRPDKILVFVNLDYWVPDITMVSGVPSEDIIQTGGVSLDAGVIFDSIISRFEKILGVVFKNGIVQSIKGVFGIVETDRLCLGNICITEDELRDLLQRANVPQAIPTVQPTPTPTPTETPIPYVDPTPTPSNSPSPSPGEVLPTDLITPTPEPTITVSPTPTPTPTNIPDTPTPEPTPAVSEPPTGTQADIVQSP